MAAADGLRFPVVVKANIGGSGAGIVRFDDPPTWPGRRPRTGSTSASITPPSCRSSSRPAAGTSRGSNCSAASTCTRSRCSRPGDTFNLCPADICQRSDGVELTRTACPVDAPKTGLKVEGYTPPDEVIEACESIMRESEIDVGGIEYMIDDRDGRLVYYDINALSNFVADAVNVVGFDPFARLVDFLDRKSLVGWLPRQPKRQDLTFPDAEVWDAAD